MMTPRFEPASRKNVDRTRDPYNPRKGPSKSESARIAMPSAGRSAGTWTRRSTSPSCEPARSSDGARRAGRSQTDFLPAW